MLSSRAKYALRAVLLLVERQDDGSAWTLASEMAATQAIPRKFLEAILVELRDHGVVASRRGRYGGYRLTRAPALISAGDVIRIVDGPLALAPCASRTQYGACADCVDVAACQLQPLLRQARDAMAEVLDGCSLAALAGNRRMGVARAPELAD